VERAQFVSEKAVMGELADFIESGGSADYITLSGSGEPTLSTSTGRVLRGISRMTNMPTAVLTNSSLLSLARVRRELATADLVVPSLDAATDDSFQAINRPHPAIKLSGLIGGLRQFSREHTGRIWLEVMIVRGHNDGEDELAALADAISEINPDRIQINTVVRPPAEPFAKAVDRPRLGEIAKYLSGEIISGFSGRGVGGRPGMKRRLVDLLGRRPCTLEDLVGATGIHRNEILKYLRELEEQGAIRVKTSGGERFFVRAEDNTRVDE
jgi:wyosine [tRNA(Phe)-imidazoG37] synthetase (radical SAM superfamily)